MGRLGGPRPTWWKLVLALAAVALVLVACGSGGGTGAPSPGVSSPATSTPQANTVVCQDAAALRDSLDKLTHVSVGTGTADQIKANLADVQAKLSTLTADASGLWRAQTSALSDALGKLQTAVSTLASHPSTSSVGGVLTALGEVTTATQNFLAVVSTRCPSVTPSASS